MARNHGTISTYRDGCRCQDCDTYARAYERERGRRRRVGAPTTNLVDATPVRQHLRQLMRAGMSYRDINAMLGINIHYLLYQPIKRVNPVTARRILEIPIPRSPLPTAKPIPADGSRRRTQALYTLGYSIAWQATHAGVSRNLISRVIHGQSSSIMACHAAKIRELYDAYWDKPAPDTRESRGIRTRARKRGWLPPLAWDDELIDLTEDELEAELERRTALMTDAELIRCMRAYQAGDRSPLIVAACRTHWRRLSARRKERKAA